MRPKAWKNTLTGEAVLSLKEAGRLLAELRKRRGMTLVEVARRAGVDRRTLSQLEAGYSGVSVGLFFQVLSLFGLAKGFEEFLKPENDIDTASWKLRQIRKKRKTSKAIPDNEVDF